MFIGLEAFSGEVPCPSAPASRPGRELADALTALGVWLAAAQCAVRHGAPAERLEPLLRNAADQHRRALCALRADQGSAPLVVPPPWF